MGGPGSGRWGGHVSKMTVEDCLPLGVGKLVRVGMISPSPGAGTITKSRRSWGWPRCAAWIGC